MIILKEEKMLDLTDSAIRRFKELLKQENLLDYGIRIFLVGEC